MSALQDQIRCCCDGRGLSTVRLRRLFTLLIQDLFADPEGHDEWRDELVCLTYDLENPKAGDLYIGPTFTANSENPDPVQAVYISVKQLKFTSMGIGHKVGISADNATVVYGKKALAHLNIRPKHPDVDLTLMMGESILTFLEGIRPIFLRHIPGLLNYDVVQMDEVTQDKEQPDNRYKADLAVRIEYQMLIAVTEESHKLKKFGFAVTAE